VLYDGDVCLGGGVIASSDAGHATPARPPGGRERPPVASAASAERA